MRAIIESDSRSEDKRFQALKDLAYLSGVVVRELANVDGGAAGPDDATEPFAATVKAGLVDLKGVKQPR